MGVVDATSCFFLNGNVKRNEKSKININKDELIFEVSKEVYPNGISKEEMIEKLKIFKQLEESGVKFTLKK